MNLNPPDNMPKEYRILWLKENLDKFCVLPWVNLNTNTNGDLKLCCNIQNEEFISSNNKRFNLGYDDIDEVWNSPYMANVRQSHRTNVGHKDCKECYHVEQVSGHSPRMGQNDEWVRKKEKDPYINDILIGATNSDVSNLETLPVSLELRLGNQCNLKCITCWPMSSSLIYTERNSLIDNGDLDDPKYTWLKSKWVEELDHVNNTDVKNWYETDMFYANFKKMAPKLKRLYVTGGEPTLIKANYKLLQMLIDAGNLDCRIEFTSNMFAWNHDFYSRLEPFKNVEVQMSLDGAETIGEYIRFPSDFSKVRENVKRIGDLAGVRPGWKLKSYTVLQALNFKYLEPVWDLLDEVAGVNKIKIDWWPITLYYPAFLSLAAVDKNKRMYFAEKIAASAVKHEPLEKWFRIARNTREALTNSIINPDYDPELNEKLRQYIALMDKSRSLDGMTLFKDIYSND